jgi:hypothetical protein
MNTRSLIPLGVVAFAITLAIILRDSLSAEGRLLALGIALGLLVGVPVGMLSIRVATWAYSAGHPPPRPQADLALSPEQTDPVVRSPERGQVSLQASGPAARQSRTFTAVGGADLPASREDDQDQGPDLQL